MKSNSKASFLEKQNIEMLKYFKNKIETNYEFQILAL